MFQISYFIWNKKANMTVQLSHGEGRETFLEKPSPFEGLNEVRINCFAPSGRSAQLKQHAAGENTFWMEH